MKTTLPLTCSFLLIVSILAKASLLSVNNLQTTDPPPKVSISSLQAIAPYSNPIPLKASFSEPVSGFSAEDISVTNGKVTSFRQSVTYSATLGPNLANDPSLMFYRAIDFDKEGNLYAVDTRSHQVKIFDSQHNFIRALGTGQSGNSNQAFNTPTDITFDQQGNLYVIDQGNFRVQVYDQNLEYMATIGSGQTGYDNNDLNSPKHIAVDQEGRVFITNEHTHKIQVFNADFSYLTRLGNNNSGSDPGLFNRPAGMAVDALGNIYIADEFNYRVQIFDRNLQYVNMIGGSSQGSEPGMFKVPADIDIDDKGFLYVTDRDNFDIRVFDQNLNPVQIIGTTGNSDLSEISLSPGNIALDNENNIYCTDLTQRIKVFDQTYSLVKTIEGGIIGTGNYQFRQPGDVAFDKEQNVYVADLYNFRIQVYDQDLQFIRSLDLSAGNNPPIYSILAFALNSKNDIYIGNYGKILVYDQDANYKTSILAPDWYTEQQKRNFYPQSIKFNSKGQIHIGDWANNFVLIYDQDLNFLRAIGSGETGNGEYQFNGPRDMAIDRADHIYVANLSNGRVQKFDSNGQYISSLYPNEISNTSISNVNFIAADSIGNLYISDSGNEVVEVFDQDYNYISTIGQPGISGITNDVFTIPYGVAIDHQNRIYVTDAYRVQRFEALTDYQFEVTPTGEGTVQVDIPAGVATDVSGNPNEAAESFTVTYDKRPEVTLGGATFNAQEQAFTLAISFDEVVSGFSTADITISNGSISELQTTDSISFQATVTPAGDGDIHISIAENAVFDLAGNGNLASEAIIFNYDGISPSAKFTTELPLITNQNPFKVDLIFSEQLSGLSQDDFQLSNGSISSLGIPIPVYTSTIGAQPVDEIEESTGQFNHPVEVHTDSKNWVYVADQGNHRIQIYDDQLNHVKTFEGVSEYPNYEQFSLPSDVATDTEGRIYVADAYTQAVQIYDQNFNHVGYIPVGYGADGGNSHYEMSVDVDQEGNIYVASTYNNNLVVFDNKLQLVSTLYRDSLGDLWFIEPTDVKIDHEGKIYVTSTYNYRMLVFDADLKHKATLDTRPFISHPQSIDIDNSGNIYIVDSREHAIQVFNAELEYLYTIGNGQGINDNQFSNPQGIAINENGHIYVADQDNHRIQVFTPPVNYQLEITPATDGEVVVELPANATTDLFGNGNEAARFSITYDGSGPLASFSSADSLSRQPAVEVEISFAEQVSGLQASNFIMTNATLANLQTSDSTHFTAQLRAEEEGYFSITLDSASVRDRLGNLNTQSAGILLQYRILRDTLGPSVEIRSTARDTVEGDFVLDFVFSEQVSGFEAADITLNNARILSLESSDSTLFSATVTPLEKGMLSLSLAEGVAIDSAGNSNLASGIFSLYYDKSFSLQLEVSTEAGAEVGTFTATLYQRQNGKYASFISQEISQSNTAQFAKLPEGEYTLGIQSVDASLLTTYLGDELLLAEAQPFYLDRDITQNISFISAAAEQSEGIANISGVLLKDEAVNSGKFVSGSQQLNGTPLANVKVYLLNADNEQIIASDITDDEGRFSFSKLPQGEYLLVADHEGLPNDKQANRINIASDTELVSLMAVVGTDVRVAQMQEEKQITSVTEEVFSRISYYPNPVTDILTLEISPDWLNGQMMLRDKLGRLLVSSTLTSERSEIDFTHLPAGVYIISILKGDSHQTFKISR